MPRLEDQALRGLAQQAARTLYGAAPTVVEVRQEPCPKASWYASYRVDLRLSNGCTSSVYVKDFSHYVAEKDGMRQRRERELHTYQRLLRHDEVGTPRYLGSIWDEHQQRYWLALEYLEGSTLKSHPYTEWPKAAAWLGRFHAVSAAAPTPSAASLAVYDAAHFRTTAERAVLALGAQPELQTRVQDLLGSFQPVIAELAAGPQTLVHGAYVARNIFVDSSMRIRPLDWELAGIGPRVYDLGHLVDGFGGDRLDEMCEAYTREAVHQVHDLPAPTDLLRGIAGIRMYKRFVWIIQSQERGYPAEKVHKLVGQATALADELSCV